MTMPATSLVPSSYGPMRLLCFGPPGVGKGTFANLLRKHFKIPHISTGDLIRAEVKSGSVLGKNFRNYSDRGALVPDELVCDIAKKRLRKDDTALGYILDGFPRTVHQAELLEESMPTALCLNFTLPHHLLIKKISGRRVCTKCSKSFNIANINDGPYQMSPLLPNEDGSCNSCGCKDVTQRSDDLPHVAESRLELYSKETAPLIEYYIRRGVLRTFGVTKGVKDFNAVANMVKESMMELYNLHHPPLRSSEKGLFTEMKSSDVKHRNVAA